ncbi:MAG: VWA domain-containing protein [Nitrospirae bacterium]|nr:VWA domain-containing protein [Nitrospirota bacterium]
MRFAEPWWLLLLLPLALAGFAAWRSERARVLAHPTLAGLVRAGLPAGRMARLRHLPLVLRLLAAALLVVALARPQAGVTGGVVTHHGVDVLIALDISGSMSLQDFDPDRITVAKQVVAGFVQGRPHDRLGLVVFAGAAYTQVPLTLDHRVFLELLDQVHLGLVADGTAIGSALATAVGRLKDSDARSRVVVLLTDGANNAGEIDPVTAADLARQVGIRVYTVGVGRNGWITQMRDDPLRGRIPVRVRSDLDEALLQQVAEVTGGRFFRAQDEAALRDIYQRIDALEKSAFTAQPYLDYSDRYGPPLAGALALLLLEWTLSATRLRRLPG